MLAIGLAEGLFDDGASADPDAAAAGAIGLFDALATKDVCTGWEVRALDALNQRLSEQRASNAKDYLVSQGVSANAISSKGFGEASPIASNDTAEGRQENRRVELVVSGEGITGNQNAGM